MSTSTSLHWIGVAFYLGTIAAIFAQTAPSLQSAQQDSSFSASTAVSQSQLTLQAFQAEQQVLSQSFNALLTLNPTPQQLQAWQRQNAVALANQRQLALNLAADSALEFQPLSGPLNIPANASNTLKDFLTTQAELAKARAQIHNQLLNALPSEVASAQISRAQQSEGQLFQQQQGANLQLQAQRAQTLANESARQSLPPPLFIPLGSSPQMAAYLTARYQLACKQIAFSNQYVRATSAVRHAAVVQWMHQNASEFQQVRDLAQNLSQIGSTTQN